MPTLQPWRIIRDTPRAGAENMAVDEALLAAVAAGRCGPVLRAYTWQPATLSLGYFQRVGERDQHLSSRDCPVVRRASGGGAILHDQELTYSLVIPGELLPTRTETLYRLVHQSLIATLAEEWSIGALFWDEYLAAHPSLCDRFTLDSAKNPIPAACGEANSPRATDSFLCFLRRTGGDLVLPVPRERRGTPGFQAETIKILGSAQRRPRGALLQHGSLLLNRSPFAPELPGLNDLCGTNLTPDQVFDAWLPRITAALGASPVQAVAADLIDPAEFAAACEKFHSLEWQQMRV